MEEKKHRGRPRKHKKVVKMNDDERGAYLAHVLGLDQIKPKQTTTVKKVKVVEKSPYEEYSKKEFGYKKEDFIIKSVGKEFIVGHKNWGNVFITNSSRHIKSKEEADKFIDEYIMNSNLPYGQRDKFEFHLAN